MPEEDCATPMTDETVDCFNCGRANPEWAQVCRSCGVVLRHGQARIVPTGRYPTDRDSLISLGAVIGTIFGALLLGLFVSSLNPIDPTVGAAPSPTPSATATPTEAPSVAPSASTSVAPVPSPTPALPGTMAFGSELDANMQVSVPVETFTPPTAFAYSVSTTQPFGASAIENEIAKITEGGENIVLPRQSVGVDPASTSFGYVIGTAGDFLGQWGPGDFEWRIYVNGEVVARGTFRYAEG